MLSVPSHLTITFTSNDEMGIEGFSDTAKVTQLLSAEGGGWKTAIEAQVAMETEEGRVGEASCAWKYPSDSQIGD